jgi:leucyl-tRNA synthetase
MVLAPEHALVAGLTAPEQRAEVEAYVARARPETEIERLSTDREKTGVPLGADAINPVNGERIPIWIADYVLSSYGTGAIMAVPGHDERDFAFAQKFGIPIVRVVAGPDDPDDAPLEEAYVT